MERFNKRNGWYNKNFALLVDTDTIDLYSFFFSHTNYESRSRKKETRLVLSARIYRRFLFNTRKGV